MPLEFDLILIDHAGLPHLGRIPFVDPQEISGGFSSAAAAKADQQIEEFIAEGGGVLALPYGEHVIGGILIRHIFTPGSPNTSKIYVALGDAEGAGGGHRRWQSAEKVWYAGEELSVSPDESTAGYRFYPGAISTAVDSGPQPVDPFEPSGLAYSGTAYVVAFLNNAAQTAQDRPERLRVRAKCIKTFDFDATGRVLGAESYSVNPARIAADRVLAYWERKFPNDPALALRKTQETIDWEAWVAWRDYCAEKITWFNGVEEVEIDRFECHVVFTEDATLDEALDQICATCASTWQLDGSSIIFLPFDEREPIHHFNESNIIAASDVEPRDLRQRPNYVILKYRDLGDTFMGLITSEARRESLRRQAGEVKSERSMPPMNKSQGDRLAEFMMRFESDSDQLWLIRGDEKSMRVLPGDYVTVSHPLTGWGEYQRCVVLAANLSGAEEAPDHSDFLLQKIDRPLINDAAHGPKQSQLQEVQSQTLNPTSFTTPDPDPGQGGSAVTTPSNTGHALTAVAAGDVEIKTCLWTAFQSPGGPVVSLVLKFDWSADGSPADGATEFLAQYSVNGGSNWTTAVHEADIFGPTGAQSFSVALAPSQDISQVRVRDKLTAQVGSATLGVTVSNIRLEVEHE
jgi:hypothetical protein